jgi:hypothetical protein
MHFFVSCNAGGGRQVLVRVEAPNAALSALFGVCLCFALLCSQVNLDLGASTQVCVPCALQHTRVRCVTDASRGFVYNLTVVVVGVASNMRPYSFAAIVDSTPPALLIASVSPALGPSELATVGGDVVVLTGTRFGSVCGLNTLAIGTTLLTSLTQCNATRIVAVIPPGSGVLGQLSLTVGVLGATLGASASDVFSYAVPTIASLAGDALLPAAGVFVVGGAPVPSNVTLLGANFGPPGSLYTVTFSSAADGLVRVASTCTRDPVRHAWISCFGVVGVGLHHRWVVNVTGQASAPSTSTTSFRRPTVSAVFGPGGRNANTDGGQVVLLSGADFGPPSASAPVSNDALVSVVYGPPGDPARYTASACAVSSVSLQEAVLTCVTASGTGGNLFWTVTVGGQAGLSPVGPTSYGWPIISSFEGEGAASGVTLGNETVMILGSNFGPAGTVVDAVYTAPVLVTSVVPAPSGGATTVNASEPVLAEFVATGCVVVVAHRQVNCTTVAGAGADIVWRLTIDGLVSQSPVTSYRAPALASLEMVAVVVNGTLVPATDPLGSLSLLSTEGGEVLRIRGDNFGPAAPQPFVDSVVYGGGLAGVQYRMTNCTFAVPHQELMCVTAPGVGSGHKLQVSLLRTVRARAFVAGQCMVPIAGISWFVVYLPMHPLVPPPPPPLPLLSCPGVFCCRCLSWRSPLAFPSRRCRTTRLRCCLRPRRRFPPAAAS